MEEKEQWREKTNEVIAKNLMDRVAELLGGEVKHYSCYDYGEKNTQHNKFVIEYGHQEKD